MPPVLNPSNSKVDGLAFLGLSLSRKSKRGHPESATHQQSFDLDLFQDRDYEYLFSSNDDGWLVGGGEPGPPTSYKLAAKDSAHVEIMRIGTYREDWGGVPKEIIVEYLRRGDILIPEITAVPTSVVANGDKPPELEIRFDMVPAIPNFDDLSAPLPLNWQLRFLQNQLFHKFHFASRFTPGAFHSTILRKAEFRSEEARWAYFRKCQAICNKWIERGAQPLAPSREGLSKSIEVVKCLTRDPLRADGSTEAPKNEDEEGLQDYYRSGLWLFTDRNHISHQFLPNFFPPYDTPIKKKFILNVLREEWDEKLLLWKPVTIQQQAMRFFSFGRSETWSPQISAQQEKAVQIPARQEKVVHISAQQEKEVQNEEEHTEGTSLPEEPEIYENSSKKKDPSVTQETAMVVSDSLNAGLAEMFDPNDQDGLAHFVKSMGINVAQMTFDTFDSCGVELDAMHNLRQGHAITQTEEKEGFFEDGFAGKRSVRAPKIPKVVVTGMHLDKIDPTGLNSVIGVIDVTKY